MRLVGKRRNRLTNEGLLLWRRAEEILQMLPDLIRNFHQNRTTFLVQAGCFVMEPDIYALSKAGFSEERIEEIISTCQARDCQSIAYLPIENGQLL